MKTPHSTPVFTARIITQDFDRFTSEVTAQIWNRVVNHPHFYSLRPEDFAELFEAVRRSLEEYRTNSKP